MRRRSAVLCNLGQGLASSRWLMFIPRTGRYHAIMAFMSLEEATSCSLEWMIVSVIHLHELLNRS